jgi:tetratricopeptide (TPR) repeat protein
MQEPTAASVNEAAIALRAQGRLREAVAVFSEGIALFPNAAVLYNNLAMTLDELGSPREALLAYESALMRAPNLVGSLAGKANLLVREGRLDDARAAYAAALAVEPGSVAVNMGLYELLQIQGDMRAAREHQLRALQELRLFSSIAPDEERSVLVLCAPGDWQANIPVDFLFDRTKTSVHKLYLLDEKRMREQPLPDYDVVLNAIAESEAAIPYLDLARSFVDAQAGPSLNAPERVSAIGRLQLPQTLRGVDCTVAPIAEITAAALDANASPFAYPIIARPVGSHAGHDLARIATPGEAREYAAKTGAPSYFVSPFIDYSNAADGLFRKYRIVYVDGEAFPVHLAISPNWMIHYYNAAMADHQWMRDEEARFLADLGSVFHGDLGAAVDGVARAVGLEYFGIDCAVGRDGRLLVFEADSAMLVHSTDPVDLYPYKHEYIPRIYRALERMLDRRKAADT